MNENPIIQITPPEVSVIKKNNIIINQYNYDNSHLIYNTEDIGSFKEISNMKQENQQLKEQLVNSYQEFKLNNVSTATEHRMICMQDEIHKEEVDKLKEHINYLQDQLKQRDEVIDDTIKFCNYLLENKEVEIDGEVYFKHSCDDIITNAVLKRLQRYRGNNK